MRLVSVVAATVALAVIAAGCGGGQSAEEKWADNVCTDITNWQSQVKKSSNDIKEQLQSPAAGMLAAVNTEIQEAVDATTELATNLKALEPASGDEGAQAKQQLDALTTQLETTTSQAKQTVDSVPEGASASETLQTLAPLGPALQSLSVNTSNTLASLKASGQKIKKASTRPTRASSSAEAEPPPSARR